MFYDKLKQLCEETKVSIYKLAVEMGYSRSAVERWKSGSVPGGNSIGKIADYFGVSVNCLLGENEGKTVAEKHEINNEDLKILIFGADYKASDEQLKEVLSFAEFVKTEI